MPEKIKSIDGLRVVLCVFVFLFHCEFYLNHTPIYDHFLFAGGSMAVSFFFVISGFVIGIKKNDYDSKSSTFSGNKERIKHKFKKPYLFHILSLIVYLPLYFYIKGEIELAFFPKIAINALLLQSWIPIPGAYLGFNGVSWYLSTLLFLTLFEPVILKLVNMIKTNTKRVFVLLSIYIFILLFGVICNKVLKEQYSYYLQYIFPPIRMLDFAGGVLLGRIYYDTKEHVKNLKINISILESLLFIFIIICMFMYCYIFLNEGKKITAIWFPGACVSILLLAYEKGFFSKMLVKISFLGKFTLSYYLVHQVVINYVRHLFPQFSYIVGIGVSFIISCVFCVVYELFYKFINEKSNPKLC